jgi:hypothetical protein
MRVFYERSSGGSFSPRGDWRAPSHDNSAAGLRAMEEAPD